MAVSKNLIEELRNAFVNDVSSKGFEKISESNVKMDILCSGAFFPHGTDIDGCTLLIFKCNRSTKGAVDADDLRRCVVYWFERLESHSNQELEESMEELDNLQSETPAEEEEEDEKEYDRTLKTADLTRILSSIERLTDELCEIDGDFNRSANVKRSVTAAVRPYAMILQERKQQSKQMKLDAFSKKRFNLILFNSRQTKGEKITIFFDMEGCGLSNMDMDFIKYLIGLFKEYYPFFLNYIIIFEMPWILSAAFKIIKSWLPEKAIEKIKFVSKKDIKTYVPLDQALVSWGGQDNYVFSFIPEVAPEKEKSVNESWASNNNKKVHFVDGSMSELSVSSGDKEFDGGSLKVTPSSIISFVRDGNELSSALELQNVDASIHLSYKLKTTSPEKFRVKPSAGCLAPGETTTVTVTLLPGFQLGGLSRDKFLVMSTQVEPSELGSQDLSELWKNTPGRKINQHRLKCIQSGEITKNGNVGSVTTQESDQNNFNKLSASVAQLNSCQMELHRAIKRTQYYQIATGFLILLLGIVLGYTLRTNLREISSSHYYCRDASHP
ncbi:hypothetical protein NQ318_003124 [Aromia moschata]|uniref:Motile sperm domain-containing protein 2 n=1 Tax=Aromia moschata TaxID=1265417 RepID=A0AAV8YT22_9CUCU|nr:hypothetical protein NQ318_003124 [Aromia moschata]